MKNMITSKKRFFILPYQTLFSLFYCLIQLNYILPIPYSMFFHFKEWTSSNLFYFSYLFIPITMPINTTTTSPNHCIISITIFQFKTQDSSNLFYLSHHFTPLIRMIPISPKHCIISTTFFLSKTRFSSNLFYLSYLFTSSITATLSPNHFIISNSISQFKTQFSSNLFYLSCHFTTHIRMIPISPTH